MLTGFKRWLSTSTSTGTAGWEAVAAWAEAGRHSFRGQQGEGFVIDGRTGTVPWRLEWGPSQRPYFLGGELRLRAEPGVDTELQLLLITRGLQEQLEKTIFEQYVEDVQTRIDNQTPPEMRWLVMLPKLAGNEMAPLREHYAALGNVKPWLQAWLRGGLQQALLARLPADGPAPVDDAPGDAGQPLVMMLGRGRLMLRAALDEPEVPALQRHLALFETALREARRAQEEVPLDGSAPGDSQAGASRASTHPPTNPPSKLG
jgi:hypothetical protein